MGHGLVHSTQCSTSNRFGSQYVSHEGFWSRGLPVRTLRSSERAESSVHMEGGLSSGPIVLNS